MKTEIRKELKFECAHQLASAECALCHETIHGHSYRVELFFEEGMTGLNPDGMVIDLAGGVLQEIKTFVDDYYDHALIMPATHPQIPAKEWERYLCTLGLFNRRMHVWQENPTAERMAKHIAGKVWEILQEHNSLVRIAKIIVHETATGFAQVTSPR